jgi:hypothetical protein
MTKKQILHKLIEGCDGYESFGVPTVVWNLIVELTQEVYGAEGVEIVAKYHKVYDAGASSDSECNHHSIDGWEDGGNFNVVPEVIIERLKGLK